MSGDPSSSTQGAATCPFAFLFGRKTQFSTASATCPFGQGRGQQTEGDRQGEGRVESEHQQRYDRRTENGVGGQAVASKCPLGFSSNSSSSQLSSLHCIVCRSILFLPHTTRCGHTFCLHCANRAQSCVVCGDTVEPGSLTANVVLQETLENFLRAHAGAVTFYDLYDSTELMAALKRQEENLGTQSAVERAMAKATFYMTAGMASAMGGNETAAWHWYELARDVYLEHEADEDVRKRLGILYGVMGDLNKSLGNDNDTVLACYARALSCLGDGSSSDPESHEEYQRARSALLNKTGEVHHYAGDVGQALEFYSKALAVRKARLDKLVRDQTGAPDKQANEPASHVPTEITVSAKLDVVTSHAKVADAQRTLGMDAEGAATFRDGKSLLDEVAPYMNQIHLASTHATYDALKAHFDDR